MNLNIWFKHFIYLIWIFDVGAIQPNRNDIDFAPVTQQTLVYFPQPRIVGGRDAEDNQFPYQISLRIYDRHICGGSIISRDHVVTAAHCVSTGFGSSFKKRPASIITVHAGSREVNSAGVVIGISEIIVHPNYKNFDNDIAILKLEKSLELNESIQPIALATQTPRVGASVVTTGWGRLRENGGTPQILQFNTLVLMSNAKCKRRIGNIPPSTLCLGHTVGNGVCSGDSGGPAVYNNQLVGVTNFVVSGCGSNTPDGYANVVFFSNWIRSNTNLK